MAEEIITTVKLPTEKGIPELLQYIALDDMQVELRKLNKHFADEESEGQTHTENLNGNDTMQEYGLLSHSLPHAQSLSGINMGPGAIDIYINNPFYQPRRLAINGGYNIDFHTHKIERLFYQCPLGITAVFSVTFKW